MAEKFTYEEVCRALGHIYEDPPDPENARGFAYNRHITKQLLPEGLALTLCARVVDATERLIAPALWRDSNCDQCRQMAGFAAISLTKRMLLVNCVNLLMNIEQDFLEAMWWNHNRTEGEEAINPDPDGFLADAWEQNVDQVNRMLERFRETMRNHSSKFGWPELIAKED